MFNDDIIIVLFAFSPLFSIKVWSYAQILLTGAIVCNNQRTVAAILRVMGLSTLIHGDGSNTLVKNETAVIVDTNTRKETKNSP